MTLFKKSNLVASTLVCEFKRRLKSATPKRRLKSATPKRRLKPSTTISNNIYYNPANGGRGKSVFSRWKKGLFLLVFTVVVAGMFFAVKGAIIEGKPGIGTMNGGRLIGTITGARPIGQAVEEMDRNGDGKTDIWRYLKDDVLMRSEVDSDYDGKIDFWAYYKNGKTERQEIDRDNNGIKDAWAYFEEGVKVRQEVDLNHDGKADAWFYYKLGKLCGRAVDSNFDGKIDEVFGEVPRRLKSATP